MYFYRVYTLTRMESHRAHDTEISLREKFLQPYVQVSYKYEYDTEKFRITEPKYSPNSTK